MSPDDFCVYEHLSILYVVNLDQYDVIKCRLFNIAMDNGPFMDDSLRFSLLKNGDFAQLR